MKWFPKSPPRKALWAREDGGVKRSLYSCKFMSEGYLEPHRDYEERSIDFFALKPSAAAREIAAAGAPMSMDKQIIN